MPVSDKISEVEIRSEEVQDILGATPAWIIRAGIGVVLAVVVAILIGSWFFKYPDVIQSRITLTTQNPPASLIAMSSGKITSLFVDEKQHVSEDKVIAIIENTAHFEDVIHLENILDTIRDLSSFNDSTRLVLGDFQQSYSTFTRLLKDYRSFKQLDYYEEKIGSVKKQKEDYRQYYKQLLKQQELKEQELILSKKQFEREESLYKSGVYSRMDFEKAEKQYLQEKLSFENIRTTLVNTQMEINKLDQQVLDLKLQETKEENRQQIVIEEALQNLRSQVNRWKQGFLITSPIDGQVTFTKIWSKNQNIQAGEIVATVIPNKATNIIGKVKIPAVGVGKVKPGQTVNIKFDNFPHMEFGLLRGSVKTISMVPEVSESGAIYTAEIEIPDTLISNYGKKLSFSQEMTGTAEIITDDIRLLERFLNPLKSIWKESVE